MDATTSKQVFYVPALVKSDGIFRLWPNFHLSPFFAAGGHAWCFSYYPYSLYDDDSVDLCLHLEYSEGAKVTVSCAIGLVDPTGSLPPLKLVKPSPPLEFDFNDDDRRSFFHSVPKCLLTEAIRQGYMQDQSGLLFEWIITLLPEARMPMPVAVPMRMMPETVPEVMMPMRMPEPESVPEMVLETADADAGAVPAADIPMLKLLMPLPKVPTTTEMVEPASKIVPATTADVAPVGKVQATDVTFSVGEKLFHAHKAILSIRSPVFKAELSEASPTETIEVDGMTPNVFDALLHYVYTNTLLATTEEGQSDKDAIQTTHSLLMAADRYGMDDGLKHLCEERLANMVDADNVADMLVLADEKFCPALQDVCIGFLMAPGRMKDVVATQGYQWLRMKHPSILVDVLEKSLLLPQLYLQHQNVAQRDKSD